MAMKVLQCSFLSGIRLQKVQPLLNTLQPKVVLFPKDLKLINSSKSTAFSIFHYCIDETLHIPSLKDKSELEIATDLTFHFDWRNLKQGSISMTRLKGELFREHGKQRLISGNVQESSEIRLLVHWGSPDLERLLTVLSSRGIKGTLQKASSGSESENASVVLVNDPSQALIEVKEMSSDRNLFLRREKLDLRISYKSTGIYVHDNVYGSHAYTGSKHAVLGLTKNVAAELGIHGIRVNCVSPYAIATGLALAHLHEEERTEDAWTGFRDFVGRNANLQGVELTVEDVANAVLFLASDESRYISGDNLMIDGGFMSVNHSLRVFR